jgi:hypothetical protein
MPDDYVDISDQLELLQSMTLDDSTEQDKVDALWRQLMVYKSFGDTDLSDAKTRRAQAEAAREQAQMEAIRTTQLLCARMRTEADLELQEARKAKAQAEETFKEAEEYLKKVQEKKEQFEKERADMIAEAQHKAQAIIDGAHDIAKRETTELRRHALKEIKAVLSRVESMRATMDEEVETQRILTNISKIKATSRWLLEEPDQQDEWPAMGEERVHHTVAASAANGSVAPASSPRQAAAPARKSGARQRKAASNKS